MSPCAANGLLPAHTAHATRRRAGPPRALEPRYPARHRRAIGTAEADGISPRVSTTSGRGRSMPGALDPRWRAQPPTPVFPRTPPASLDGRGELGGPALKLRLFQRPRRQTKARLWLELGPRGPSCLELGLRRPRGPERRSRLRLLAADRHAHACGVALRNLGWQWALTPRNLARIGALGAAFRGEADLGGPEPVSPRGSGPKIGFATDSRAGSTKSRRNPNAHFRPKFRKTSGLRGGGAAPP